MDNYTSKTVEKVDEKRGSYTKYCLDNLILMFFIFAFSGWVWEVIYIGVTEGVIAKRGMLHGPWLPIYGVGGILILLILSRFQAHPAAVFVLAVLMCGTMEYSTGLAVEYIFRCRWWDYSEKFMNINGRVCLEGLTLFGVTGTIATCKVGPMLNDAIGKLHRQLHTFLNIVLSVAFILDLVFSMFVPNMGVGVTYSLLK
ncbi:MAG: putative ABC transporter permease [Clostridiales bacterium]|nr:putative ABC transporter permease [Clostridiales bacterium]